MRGRLTNTPENLIASEWIKSRFERLGLARGRARLLSDVQPDDGDARTGQRARDHRRRRPVPGRAWAGVHDAAIQRDRRRPRARGVRRLRHHRAGPRPRRLSRRRRHQRCDRPGRGPRARRARPEQPVRRRRDVGRRRHAAQGAGRAGERRRRRFSTSPTCTTIQAPTPNAGGNSWPQQPSRLGTYSLAGWMDSIKIPAAQITSRSGQPAGQRFGPDARRPLEVGGHTGRRSGRPASGGRGRT